MGYVVAYATAGLVADTLGTLTGRVGSGAAMGIIISGILLMFIFSKRYQKIEDEEMTSVLSKSYSCLRFLIYNDTI